MRILTNFPYSPFTNQTGSTKRFLQNINGLRELGHDVVVWSISSIEDKSPYKWQVEDLAIAEEEGFEIKLTYDWVLPAPFLRKVDAVWINYYDKIEKFKEFNGPKICEMHDILTVHNQIKEFLASHLTMVGDKWSFKNYPELFNPQQQFIFPVQQEEIRAYKECDCVIAISSSENKILESVGVRTKHIPYQDFTEYPTSERTGYPLYIGSDNLFNLFAVEFLGEFIVPSVRARCFDFEAQCVGGITQSVRPFGFLRYSPYNINIEEVYKNSAFGLCSLLYGTGSKIKLYEMMAYGLPVVAFHSQIGDAPIINGETGFRCFTVGEFVYGCERLWKDKRLRMKLGNNAREAIRSMYSKEQHLQDLEEILKWM